MTEATPRDQLLSEYADAFERVIETATNAGKSGLSSSGDGWGPREIIAHLAGWEVMAAERIPKIVAGMPPLEFADEAQQEVMDDAINATIVTMIGDQSLDTVCGLLRRAHQRVLALLDTLDDTYFQPGEYVYERAKGIIEHCQEHQEHILALAAE